MKYSKYLRFRRCHSTTALIIPNFQYLSLNEYNLTKWMERRGFSTPDFIFNDIQRKRREWEKILWASNVQLNDIDIENKDETDESDNSENNSSDRDNSETKISEKRIIDLFRENHPVVILIDDEEEYVYKNNWFDDCLNYLINCFKQCSGIVEEEKPKKINRNYSTCSNHIELQEIKKNNI